MKKKLILILMATFLFAYVICGSFTASAATVNHVLRNGKDMVTLVDSTTDLTKKLSDTTEEDYRPENRQWNGICTSISYGNNLYVAWYTGGDREPHDDNHIVVAASDDNGETWIDPFMIIDPVDTSKKTVLPMFFINGAGDLFLYFTVLPGSKLWATKLIDADGPLANVTYTEPEIIGPRSLFCKPTILSDGTILYASGGEDGYTNIYRSTNDGASYEFLVSVKSKYVLPVKRYSEAVIVEKNDGMLWLISRLETGYDGGFEMAYSSDKGLTWSTSEGDLPYPLNGPGSRGAAMKLQSGNLIFITNDSLSSRNMMTVFMSDNDGDSWDYSIVIDRYESAYPDVSQTEDGRIIISYDKGRYTEDSIRLTILTEEDIRAGYFVSEEARDKKIVCAGDPRYMDIVSVKGVYERSYQHKIGTSSASIRANLPQSFTVVLEDGSEMTVEGIWRSSGYKQDVEGTYRVYFVTDSLDSYVTDSYDFFSIYVTLSKGGSSGGAGGCAKSGAGMLSVILSLVAVTIIGKRH